jgi:integrase
LAVYRRGDTWWYKFRINGVVIRESAKTNSKTIAREAERVRRRQLEESVNRISKRERMPLFSVAAEEWLATKTNLSRFSGLHYRQYVNSLSDIFGRRLVCDVDLADVGELQRKRQAEGKAGRTVNAEAGVLRQILKHYGLWSGMADKVRFLRENRDAGKAVSTEDERLILDAVRESRSPALLPRFVLAIDTGLRANEMRTLRLQDLTLNWSAGAIESGEIVVRKSKTEGGTGRIVPLTRRACATLTIWLSRFPAADPATYLFPGHKVGFAGDKREPFIYDVKPSRQAGEWKSAWRAVCSRAGVNYRWHDLRHTFITRLAENPAVSEQTITALAGHVSKRMLERYSHIRRAAKQAAIASLERADFQEGRAQNWAQSDNRDSADIAAVSEKVLN